jgi:hypothetical protein
MAKAKVILDATLLTSLMSCPRKADLRFNELLVPIDGKSNSLECGSLVHVILEYFNKGKMAGLGRNDAIELGFAAGRTYIAGCKTCGNAEAPCTKHKDNDWTGMVNTPEESDRKFTGWKWVLSTMEQYFDYYHNDSFITIAAEEVRGEQVYEDDDIAVIWKAKFDEIVDTEIGLVPRDHKTMKQNRDTLTLNNQFIGQCLLTKSRTIVVNKIGFQTSLKPEEKFIRASISYSADKFAEWINDILPYYARMLVAYTQAGHFPPNFDSCEGKYGMCNYLTNICEVDRGMRDSNKLIYFKKGRMWDINND